MRVNKHKFFKIVTERSINLSTCVVLLQKTVASPGRGILAMDESNATCGKRLASIGLENTEANRQAYRTLLVTAPELGKYISGAILFEETLYQSTVDGEKIVDVLVKQGIVPGIKVDKVRPLSPCNPNKNSKRYWKFRDFEFNKKTLPWKRKVFTYFCSELACLFLLKQIPLFF